ncbi:short-chain fatty acid transporter [Sedimentibacter sp. zth1]|uniref:short-chain fatty acid transporter n=1 Tax=Sedimentibacter sp. zth1 TaxID=2816908 RepID=UPI001A92BCB0|nr:short-chain fatty acid transporter [Sedimentibacter sp. zth1]QSX05763.1 short-chain fatty acid transporter [Sedimentibacter sp. zth1]
MFKKFTNGCVSVMNKFLPDPFIFAIILTIVVFVAGIIFTGQGPLAMLLNWAGGFWGLLAFSMQMALVLVLGNTMAKANVFQNLLKKIASRAKTPGRAIMLTAVVSIICCWINWGFGLVIGALLAKEMAKQVKGVDYRLLIATAYSGFVVWHGGMSGSIPLNISTVTTLADGSTVVANTGGALTEAISTSMTIFSPMSLVISGLLVIGIPFVCRAMMPDKEHTIEVDPALLVEEKEKVYEIKTPADKIEHSKILWLITVAFGVVFILYNISKNGLNSLNLNFVNFIFLFVGMILHGNIRKYIDAFIDSTKGCSGVLLQFPFYAGIQGMMTGAAIGGVSLAAVISNAFVSIANTTTFPLFTFLSAGIVNFFVPSGGGQWAVQGPIMMPAALKIGVSPAKTAMAIAWGDAWTNMIQPFWALPALGIAGLSAKDIMGYCVITLLFSGVIICGCLLIF